MRTTITLDDDVLQKARAAAAKSRLPFRQVINEALRAGLRAAATPPAVVPFRTEPHKMGLKAGRNLDNIQELIGQIEGSPQHDPARAWSRCLISALDAIAR